MTWEIAAGIIEAAMFLIAVVNLVHGNAKEKANQATSQQLLAQSLDNLSESLKNFKIDAEKEHEHLNDKINRNYKDIKRHDEWIIRHDARESAECEDGK